MWCERTFVSHSERSLGAHILGCDSSKIFSEGTTVTSWDNEPVEFLVWDDGAVVGAPDAHTSAFRRQLQQLPADLTCEGAQSIVEPIAAVMDVLGPQFVGYCDWSTFTSVESDARQIDPERLTSLRDACPGDEWKRSAIQCGETSRPTFAVFRDGKSVAVSQISSVHEVAGFATISHPDYRGQGFATAAVSRAINHALERELLPEYRTVERWSSSVSLAKRLGFKRVARSILVQLS